MLYMNDDKMVAGTVTDFDSQSGTVYVVTGREWLQLAYHDGRAVVLEGASLRPVLSTSHDQPAGGRLKEPARGDAVLVQVDAPPHARALWTYMEHYLGVLENRYGSQFRRDERDRQPVV